MDLTRQTLKSSVKLFSNVGIIFELVTIFKIIFALDLCERGRGGICAEQHAF